MIDLHQVVAQHLDEKARIGDFAFTQFTAYVSTRSATKKLIKKGWFYINGVVAKSSNWVNNGDVVQFIDPEDHPPKPYEMELEVVYEDDYLAVINKPAGISVSGNEYRTIQNAIIDKIIPPLGLSDKLAWPRPVHRLDNPTGGLLVIAKTRTALKELGQLFEHKKIEKAYQAIVIGDTPENGTINTEIDGKPALTTFQKQKHIPSLSNKALSLLELTPHTGRTHQLRIHLSSIGHPIMGEKQYNSVGKHIKHKGLFLFAKKLQLVHPITKEMLHLETDLPHKFVSFMKREEERYHNFLNGK